MKKENTINTGLKNNFYINNLQKNGGPNIFCNRLKNELLNQEFLFQENSVNQISIIQGNTKSDCNNILRLDGLYLDSKNTVGDTDELNKPIYNSYKTFDQIVFQSEFSKICYESFFGECKKYKIIPNGVPDSFFAKKNPIPKPKGFDKVIIASAQWRRHKRLEEILQAFRSHKLQNIALVVLGCDQEFHDRNIFSVNMVPPENLPSFYQMADGMIHIPWIDWCPNTVVEGLASGLPLLCSHNGGTKELVKENGIIIELEEDYQPGSRIDLYNPPKVNTETIIQSVLDLIQFPKTEIRQDLKISSVANSYKKLFK